MSVNTKQLSALQLANVIAKKELSLLHEIVTERAAAKPAVKKPASKNTAKQKNK